jgi:hypothetical protein
MTSFAPLESPLLPPVAVNHVVRGPHDYTPEMRRLANLARKIAGGRAVLYHGTRYPTSILRKGVLFSPEPGLGKVSLTRSPEVAAYWALMERCPDEGRGAILLFDQNALRCRYKIRAVHEKWVKVNGGHWHDEAEEQSPDIANIARYLIGYTPTKERDYSEKEKKLHQQVFKMRRRVRKARRLLERITSAQRRLNPGQEDLGRVYPARVGGCLEQVLRRVS